MHITNVAANDAATVLNSLQVIQLRTTPGSCIAVFAGAT